MVGLNGAFSSELFASARERQRDLQAEAERARLARRTGVTTPRRLFAWLGLTNFGRSAPVEACYPTAQPVCC